MSALTVYGGTLDVTRGKLVVTHERYDMGSVNWNSGQYNIFNTTDIPIMPSPDYAGRKTGFMCEIYPASSNITIDSSMDDESMLRANGSSTIFVRDTNYTDAGTFKTAMSGKHVVVELATPLEYDLTPVQIAAILGDNNVWADTGDSTVKYKVGIQKYVDDKIAQVQALVL